MNRIPLTATVSLVAAPVVLLIARTLNVPWPGDSGPEKVGKYVQHVADAPDRSDLGAALVLLGALVLLPGVLYLGGVARSRMPRLGAVATALTVTGCVGIAVVGAISVVDGQIVRHSPPSAAVAVIFCRSMPVKPVHLPNTRHQRRTGLVAIAWMVPEAISPERVSHEVSAAIIEVSMLAA